jgi:hypothetical protein
MSTSSSATSGTAGEAEPACAAPAADPLERSSPQAAADDKNDGAAATSARGLDAPLADLPAHLLQPESAEMRRHLMFLHSAPLVTRLNFTFHPVAQLDTHGEVRFPIFISRCSDHQIRARFCALSAHSGTLYSTRLPRQCQLYFAHRTELINVSLLRSYSGFSSSLSLRVLSQILNHCKKIFTSKPVLRHEKASRVCPSFSSLNPLQVYPRLE